jgi:hypothetical protein
MFSYLLPPLLSLNRRRAHSSVVLTLYEKNAAYRYRYFAKPHSANLKEFVAITGVKDEWSHTSSNCEYFFILLPVA